MGVLIFFLLATVSCFGNLKTIEKKIDALEKQSKAIPNEQYLICEPSRASLFGEYLYWKPSEEGLFFAYTNVQNRIDIPAMRHILEAHGHLKQPRINWDSGFRIGIDYQQGKTAWDWMLVWTSFNTGGSRSLHGNDQGYLGATWTTPDDQAVDQTTQAKMKWALNLNVVDFQMGFAFQPAHSFRIHPFIGISNAWIPQNFAISYHFSPGTSIPLYTDEKINTYCHFYGIGPKMGIGFQIALYKGFSLNAEAAGAFMYAFFNNGLRLRGIDDLGNQIVFFNIKDHYQLGKWAAQSSLGIQYLSNTFGKNNRFLFKIDWENNLWFGINKMIYYYDEQIELQLNEPHNDLTFQGITTTAAIQF